MKSVLTRLWRGEAPGYTAIARSPADASPVLMDLYGAPEGPVDIVTDHVVVSLAPLIVGIWRPVSALGDMPHTRRWKIVVRDVFTRQTVGTIDLAHSGIVSLAAGKLWLFRARTSRSFIAPGPARLWNYALVSNHARRTAASEGAGAMTARDLCSLSILYMLPRPVYLVGVKSGARTNLFPMDLVGPVSSGDFLLALRATSSSIVMIEQSGFVGMSAAPARHRDSVYSLGAQHRRSKLCLSDLPFSVDTARVSGIPVLEDGFISQLRVRDWYRIGSHMLFVCRVEQERRMSSGQLAHISKPYAHWLSRRGVMLATDTESSHRGARYHSSRYHKKG